jgi:amino acid adenylation domain-containing protein
MTVTTNALSDDLLGSLRLRTLVEVTRWRAVHQPNELAFTFLVDGEQQEERLTFAELDRRTRAIAAALQARGLEGQRVLLLFHPGLDYNTAVFGCLYAGAVAVPVYPPDPFRAHRTLPRLRAILDDAQAALVLSSDEIVQWAGEGITKSFGTEVMTLESMLLGPTLEWEPKFPSRDQLALLQYTSGSVDSPKGVMLSHANLMHNLASLRRVDREGAVAVCWVPPYHDMGLIGGVLLPVYCGRHMVLLSPLTFVQRPVRWLRAISHYRAITSPSPNFGYELCVRKIRPEECQGLDLSCWTAAINGAEPVRAETLARFAEAFGPYGFRRESFYPAFGMAETTLLVTGGRRGDPPLIPAFSARALEQGWVVPVEDHSSDARRLVGCGQPVPDGEVVIVDPERCQPAGAGQVGEIWFRSPSVGRGYWNRPQDTEQVFRAQLGGDLQSAYLRTGDLGFVYQDHLFVTGRLKELIILGGRNFYPQDIELTVQRCNPALKLDGGASFSIDVDGEERLVVVQEVLRPKTCDLESLLRRIREELLEEYDLVPYAIVLIAVGSLVKTSSGKTRRRECRELFLQGKLTALAEWRVELSCSAGDHERGEADLPQTYVERQLAEFWSEVLGVRSVGRNDDFFVLGGQSLRAAQLVTRVNAEFGVELPLGVLFSHPTVRELAAWIESNHNGQDGPRKSLPQDSLRRRTPDEPLVLSSAEQRLWFFDQLQPQHPFYNMPVAARIRGPLDEVALGRALQELVERHEALRTAYPARDGQPTRRIAEAFELPARLVDLQHRSAEERESELQRVLREESRRPFTLATGPLVRYILIRCAPQDHVVLLAMHHIVVDGWSVGVLLRELGLLYDAFRNGRPSPLTPLELQYADFAVWQQKQIAGDGLAQHLAYWEGQLGDEPPSLDLPTDRMRPVHQTFEGATRPIELSADLTAKIKRLSREEGATPFVILLAAYAVVLGRYCREDDIAIGTIAANRARRELENLVGFFANTLVLRTDLSGEPTFRNLVRRVSQVTWDAYAHQEIPFERLVQRLHPQRVGGQSPLFQVALVLENMPLELLASPELTVERVPIDNGTSKYDLAMLLWEESGCLRGDVEYATALFDATTIDRMIHAFCTLLEAAVVDPDRVISRLPLIDEDERRQLVRGSSPVCHDEPLPPSLHGLFEARARKSPERVAIRDRGIEVTYGELDRHAESLSVRLRSLGLGPEQPVTVCLPRSLDLVVAMLAVLKAGGVYVPLDPDQPAERLSYLLDDCKARLLVTRRSMLQRLPGKLEILGPETSDLVIAENVQGRGQLTRFRPSSEGEGLSGTTCRGNAAASTAPSDQLAYVIYTSGSTGRPKGALIEHRGVVNFVRAFNRVLEIQPGDRVLFSFSPSSDGSISDVFSALAHGACLVLADVETVLEPGRLQDLLREDQVTTATLTPSLMELLQSDELPALHTVCAVGEPLPADLAARWALGRRLINGYGLTETSIGACLGLVSLPIGHRPSIGRPLDNVQIYVLDPCLEPVPIGVPGEICIGGVQVGRGYLNQPELTAARFIPNPFCQEPGACLYRTGDLGRYRNDGSLEFLGRLDEQVKIRGFRVEPVEIASALEEHPLVDQAVVLVREDQPGQKRLVAYVVPGSAPPPGLVSQLRAHLAARLPAPMIPSAIVTLDSLPRTVQGKLDRRVLPPPERSLAANHVAPHNEQEKMIAAIWERLLGVEPIGTTDNFFELGGHSILAVQMMAEIERQTGRRLPLASLFQEATVGQLARLLRMPEMCEPETSLVLLQSKGQGRPLFCIHPAGGTVFCYRHLAEKLGQDRPLYGVQAVGIDGSREPYDRLEDMAAHYIAAIRSVQPRGPYLLAGWSLGGNLAFEVARQFSEQAETIGLLALFDTAPLRPDRAPAQEEFLPLLMDFFPDEKNLPLETLQAMSTPEQLEYFIQRAAQAQIVLAAGDSGAGRAVFEVFGANMQAILNYRQRAYPGRLTLFAVEHHPDLFPAARQPDFGWSRWAQGGVETCRVPGDHIHMVLDPHVQPLAEQLRQCLDRADHS